MSYYEKGQECMNNEDYEGAMENFKLSLENGENSHAREMFRNAMEAHGKQLNELGDKLYKKKQYREAMNYYVDSVEVMMKLNESRKVDKYTKELRKATKKLAKQINKEADQLLKDKEYEKAIDLYLDSVAYMTKVGDEKKVGNYKEELKEALVEYASEQVDHAKDLAKDEKLDEAEDEIRKAMATIERTEDEAVIKETKEDALKVYEIIADEFNDKGDKAYRDDNYGEAIKLYRKSVTWIKRANDERKTSKYQKELEKAFKKKAKEINNAGDDAYKKGDYDTAIGIYQQSIDNAESAGNTRLVEKYTDELEKAFKKYAKEINDEGDKLYKEKKYNDAAIKYTRSIELAKQSGKQNLVDRFTKELRKTYEKWADDINDEADDLVKDGKFEEAVEKYKKSIEIIHTTGDDKTVGKYVKELRDAYEDWADEMDDKGDDAYKAKKYEEAYQFYEKAVEYAELSHDDRKTKRYRRERDKSLRKIQ